MDQWFEGRHFDREIIVWCGRWTLRLELGAWDLIETMGEPGNVDGAPNILRRMRRSTHPQFECFGPSSRPLKGSLAPSSQV